MKPICSPQSLITALIAIGALALCSCTVARNVGAFWKEPVAPAIPDRLPDDDHNGGIHVWWIGHASVLIQIEDKFVLTDPVFTDFVGGVSKRVIAPGLRPDQLPALDAVLISHMHFDHLSRGSLDELGARAHVIVTPEGGSRYVPQIEGVQRRELQTWERFEAGDFTITATPVVHSGWRWIVDAPWMKRTYTGYLIEYKGKSVYFAGDTAWAPEHFDQTRERAGGGVDLALLPIAPAEPRRMYAAHHMGPEEGRSGHGTTGSASHGADPLWHVPPGRSADGSSAFAARRARQGARGRRSGPCVGHRPALGSPCAAE